MKQPMIAVAAAFSLLACSQGEPDGTYEHPEKGGICGPRHERCQEVDPTIERFRRLRKTDRQSGCIKEGGAQTFSARFSVPRMLDDHPGSKDNIELVVSAQNFSSDGADFFFLLQRNGVVTMQVVVDRFGNEVFSEHGPVDSDDQGTIESALALMADRANYRHVLDAALACEYTSPIMWEFKFNGLCVSCKLYKVGFGVLSALITKAVLKARDNNDSLLPVGVGEGVSAGIDEFLGCDRFCNIGQCGVDYDECLERAGSDDGDIERCNSGLAGCCMSARGRCVTCDAARGEHAKAGRHCCCFL